MNINIGRNESVLGHIYIGPGERDRWDQLNANAFAARFVCNYIDFITITRSRACDRQRENQHTHANNKHEPI